jgi:hypothetical protein
MAGPKVAPVFNCTTKFPAVNQPAEERRTRTSHAPFDDTVIVKVVPMLIGLTKLEPAPEAKSATVIAR